MLSTVWIRRSGPPSTIDALILLVPWPGISTHESRGMPMIVALCLSGLIETTWIESASECWMSSPIRAPLPTTRSTIGLFPVSDGAYPACALPITSPTDSGRRGRDRADRAERGAGDPRRQRDDREHTPPPAGHDGLSVGVALGDGLGACTSLLRSTLNDTTRQSPSTRWNTY